MNMSAEKTDTEKPSKDTAFTENDAENKNQGHYRYYILFEFLKLYKYSVCSFERFKRIKLTYLLLKIKIFQCI